jgi:hypothetical protein
VCSKGPFWWLGQRRDDACAGEDAVPTTGFSVVVLFQLALEWLGLETEASTHLWSELSSCCSVAIPWMSFNCWYNFLALSVEGAGRVSKSAAAAATFWLSLGKVVCAVPSWLMAMVMALARA